jgi:hypothetical protein
MLKAPNFSEALLMHYVIVTEKNCLYVQYSIWPNFLQKVPVACTMDCLPRLAQHIIANFLPLFAHWKQTRAKLIQQNRSSPQILSLTCVPRHKYKKYIVHVRVCLIPTDRIVSSKKIYCILVDRARTSFVQLATVLNLNKQSVSSVPE